MISSPLVLVGSSARQSHPLPTATLPSAPPPPPPPSDRCSWLATSELPASICVLPPPPLFRSRSAGVAPLSPPGADASTSCRNSSAAPYTRLPTACRSSTALRMTSIWSGETAGWVGWLWWTLVLSGLETKTRASPSSASRKSSLTMPSRVWSSRPPRMLSSALAMTLTSAAAACCRRAWGVACGRAASLSRIE